MEKFDLDGQEIEINNEFKGAFNLLENSGECIFVTGKAGTGKSTLLKYFVKKTKEKIVLLAPTGVAALNVGGVTIHSFFKFPPRPITDKDIRYQDDDLYKWVNTIVIDEVSMVRADMMDAIDKFMRLNGKNSSKPFGGTQMIFFGDLYQLSPIVKDEEEAKLFSSYYENEWFYSAHIFNEIELNVIELQKVYRQKDEHFIGLLDAVRKNIIDSNQLAELNQNYTNLGLEEERNYITLTCTNNRAKRINIRQLNRLAAQEYRYIGRIEGRFPPKRLPTDIELKLKAGAQVMFIKNDSRKRWVNGTIGTVYSLDEKSIKVSVSSKGHQYIHEVGIEVWEILKYKFNAIERSIETDVVGRFSQYPLKLAWAVTIHKSQGLTYNDVIIDLGEVLSRMVKLM